MALGALKAIEDAGLLGKIVIAGIDATPEALKYVKDGRLNITVFQDAKGQGARRHRSRFASSAGHGCR